MIAHGLGNGDSAYRGDTLQARSYVDAVAENVTVLHDDVAQVNTDPEFNALGRCAGVARAHARLNIDGARECADDAGKFHQHSISGKLYNPAVVLADLGIGQIFPDRFERSHGAGFVAAHKAAVADDIGGENSGQATFHKRLTFAREAECAPLLYR